MVEAIEHCHKVSQEFTGSGNGLYMVVLILGMSPICQEKKKGKEGPPSSQHYAGKISELPRKMRKDIVKLFIIVKFNNS